MIPSRFNYIGLIAKFIYTRTIQGNKSLFAVSIILGVACRVLSLLGFAMALQAIMAAIRPEIAFGLVNRILARLDAGFSIELEYLIPLLIGAILAIHSAVWVLQYIRSNLMRRLNMRIIEDERNFVSGRSMDDDIFIIEQVPGVVQAVEKCFQITLFITIILGLISFAMPVLAMLLMPVLAFLVLVQVVGDRKNLRELKQQQDTRRLYVNHTDPADGKFRRRPAPENTGDRHAYLAIREHRRHRVAIKPETDAFMGAIAITLIIYYLSVAELSIEQLAGLLILFVVGIRYVISSGRELSANILLILDMRKNLEVLAALLSENKPSA